MGTRASEKKHSVAEPLPPRKLSVKSTENISPSPSLRKEDPFAESGADTPAGGDIFTKVKFEVYGEEMISKEVKQSGNSGRVYLPPDWIGKNLKIIRID